MIAYINVLQKTRESKTMKPHFSHKLATLFFVFLIAPSFAQAAKLIVFGGELRGATAVSVLGDLYDISLVDGSCDDEFAKCDESTFAFTTRAEAQAASTALLDQVLIGSFDTAPETIFGCDNIFRCNVNTLYGVDSSNTDFVLLAQAANYPEEKDDAVYTSKLYQRSENFGIDDTNVYAMWTRSSGSVAVPAPAPGILISLSIFLLALYRKIIATQNVKS